MGGEVKPASPCCQPSSAAFTTAIGVSAAPAGAMGVRCSRPALALQQKPADSADELPQEHTFCGLVPKSQRARR